MVKIRKQIRNLHDTTLNGQRVFDAIVEGDKVICQGRVQFDPFGRLKVTQ